MSTFLKIAWRDLWRHPLRSALTLSAIVFGTAVTLFVMAFARGEHQQMIRNAIGFFPGHLQLHRAGYQREQGLAYTIKVEPKLLDYLENSPLVSGFSPRLCTETLVQAGNNISGAKICGVIPEKEIKVSRIAQTFFPQMIKTPKGVKISRRFRGEFLSSREKTEAVLGEDLAKNLQVQVGDQISILTQDFYGSLASGNFRVKGIFRAGSPEYDTSLILVNLPDLQALLYLPEAITHLVINLKHPDQVPALQSELYLLLSQEPGPWRVKKLSAPGLWQIQPQKPSLAPDSPLQLVSQPILEDVLKRIPKLKGYSLQLKAELELHHQKIFCLGVNPLEERISSGIFAELSEKEKALFQGKDWIIFRSELAKKFGLNPGARVKLSGTNYLGENFELELRLVKTFEPGNSEPDAYLPLALLQDQLRLGDTLSQVLIQLPARMPESEARQLILSRLNYEVIPWPELIPDLVQLLTLDNAGAVLWLLIILVIVAFVILLTIVMSVLERSRQFGIMKAIGTKPGEIFQIIFYESFFLGLLGTVMGLGLGAIPSLYFTLIPLKLGSLTEFMEEFGFEPFLYAQLEPRMFFYTGLIILGMVLVMTIFPALRASRVKPVESLRLQ